MRFSWTIKELHALRIALTDAQFFQADLQERMEDNGEEKTERFKKSQALQRNHEILGQKVLAEVVRRQSQSRHQRKAG